jgi:hypothetical protein
MLDTASFPQYMPSGPLREVGGGGQWGILSLNKRCVYLIALFGRRGTEFKAPLPLWERDLG